MSAQPPAGSATHRLQVDATGEGERLDQFLARRLPELSRSRLQALIDEGHVRVGGAGGRRAQRLRTGADLEVFVPAPAKIALEAEDLRLPILFEDSHLLVIAKPAGVAVHPGAGIATGTVVHGLLHHVQDLVGIGGELRPGIVHRLDKDTSGCMVVAKSEVALRGLQAAFKARTVEKNYLALVHGEPSAQGEFDTLHARHPTDRKRFSTQVREGRRAVTRWTLRGRANGASLVSVELLTGRTHQIRAHFADAGFPLVCDRLYGGRRRESRLPAEAPLRRAAEALGRQGLHAQQLAFDHPLTNERISCLAALPADFCTALEILGLPFESGGAGR